MPGSQHPSPGPSHAELKELDTFSTGVYAVNLKRFAEQKYRKRANEWIKRHNECQLWKTTQGGSPRDGRRMARGKEDHRV